MLTTKQAAERLQISEASVRVWLNNEEEKAKRFPNATKFGRDWQIPESDLAGLPVGRKPGRPCRKPADAVARVVSRKPGRPSKADDAGNGKKPAKKATGKKATGKKARA